MTVEQVKHPPDLDETVLDEKTEILIVRNIRLKINKALMSDGKIPEDPEKLDFLMSNLRDMDKSALTRSKIKSDEKITSENNQTISMVTQVFQALRGGKQLPPEDITDVEDKTGAAPQLPDELSDRTFVPGETQIGTIQEDIDTFKARTFDSI